MKGQSWFLNQIQILLLEPWLLSPDNWNGFQDIRSNNYTEPAIAGNAGLAAALVALSGGSTSKLDRNTTFYATPPLQTYDMDPQHQHLGHNDQIASEHISQARKKK